MTNPITTRMTRKALLGLLPYSDHVSPVINIPIRVLPLMRLAF